MRLITYLLFSLMLFLGMACVNSDNQTADADTNNTTEIDTNGQTDAASTKADASETDKGREDTHLFAPSEYISGIAVYDTFDEIEHILHKDSDTTYVINFWATWCKPCVEELPYLEQIHSTYKDDKVKVILVSMDFKKLIPHKLVPFIEKNNIQSEVLMLADGRASKWIDKVSTHWDGAIPYTVVYKKDKRKEFGIVESFAQIDKVVKSIMNNS